MKVFLIGVGFHAKRIYIKHLMDLYSSGKVTRIDLIDLEENRDTVQKYTNGLPCITHTTFIEGQRNKTTLGTRARNALECLAEAHSPDLIIISTEPRFHKLYAEWAIQVAPSVLMDKPVTTRAAASIDPKSAFGIWEDYSHLVELLDQPKSRKSSLIINTQRRYDPGFRACLGYIHEARVRFGMPVTSVMAMYSDGTWVMPNEFEKQESHPYKYGYGICSHSGYHILDFVAQIIRAGHPPHMSHSSFVANARVTRPSDFLEQLDESSYSNLFPEYSPTGIEPKTLRRRLRSFGEVDAHCHFEFKKSGYANCQATIALHHNSFSQRSWPISNADLYKGNGRVKQQQFIIHQGPFQTVHIHNYQSQDQHDIDNSNETDFGQNNHFDLYVFRNAKMFAGGPTLLKKTANELYPSRGDRLSIEDAKIAVLDEAIEIAVGNKEPTDSKSSIHSHDLSVKMMSASYLSMSQYFSGCNGDVDSKVFNQPFADHLYNGKN